MGYTAQGVGMGWGHAWALGRELEQLRVIPVTEGRKVCWLPFVTVVRHHDQN